LASLIHVAGGKGSTEIPVNPPQDTNQYETKLYWVLKLCGPENGMYYCFASLVFFPLPLFF